MSNDSPGWAACHGHPITDKKEGKEMATQNQLLIAEAIVIDRNEGRTKAILFLKKNPQVVNLQRALDILDQHADKEGRPLL